MKLKNKVAEKLNMKAALKMVEFMKKMSIEDLMALRNLIDKELENRARRIEKL